MSWRRSRELEDEVAETIATRIIDNAAVGVASLRRAPVVAARGAAEAHPNAATPASRGRGATVMGIEGRSVRKWAAYANGVAIRELDDHDAFLAAEHSHPRDTIPPILAVARREVPALDER